MTPPKTFLRSILSPCLHPGRNIFLTLGWQGSSPALHQPPSPHFSVRLSGAMTRFKPQCSICRPPRWLYRGDGAWGSWEASSAAPQISVVGSTAVQEADKPSFVTGSAPLRGRRLQDMSYKGPFWVTGILWPTWLMPANALSSSLSAMLKEQVHPPI